MINSIDGCKNSTLSGIKAAKYVVVNFHKVNYTAENLLLLILILV